MMNIHEALENLGSFLTMLKMDGILSEKEEILMEDTAQCIQEFVNSVIDSDDDEEDYD